MTKYMSIIYVNCGWRNKNRSNPCSYEYYSTSSEIKAWKQFRSLWNLNPWPLKYWCYCILFLIFFICTYLWQIIDKPPIKSIATSPKWFTSPVTSFPCILSVFSDSFWPFKKNCCIGRGTGSQRSALPKNTAKLPWLQLEPHPQIEDLDKHT